jgi:CBS domain-containing protein
MSVRVPFQTVSERAKVSDAVTAMVKSGHAIVGATHEERLVGVFTLRDLAERVVLAKRDPEKTPIGEVMTKEPYTLPTGAPVEEAFRRLVEKGLGYIPVVDEAGRPQGMYEFRSLLLHRLQDVTGQIDSIIRYFETDSIGGD